MKRAVLTIGYYLLGCPFTCCFNHILLQWLQYMKDVNAWITPWYLSLQAFKFTDDGGRLPLP